MLNVLENERIYGGWYIKGIYTLQNSTSNEMFSRLDKDVVITENDRGYVRSASFSIDGGKKRAYIPLSTNSEKNINDIIQLKECCVVVMGKHGEDDIYRIIEKSSVVNCDENAIMHDDIFAYVQIYGSEFKEISRRLINSSELTHLNTYVPGIVVDNGRGGYSCKLFAKGSTTQFYHKQIAPESDVHVGDMFDIMKCEIRSYKRDDSAEIKVKVFVPTEAKDLSRIESLKKQEEEQRNKGAIRKQEQIKKELFRKQTEAKLSIFRIQKFIESDDVEIETINKEYQQLCSLIGSDKAEEYKPYIDKAIEKANERAIITRNRIEEERKKRRRELKMLVWCFFCLVIIVLLLLW